MKKTLKVLFASLVGAMALISHAVAQPVLVTNAPAAGTFYLLSVHPSLPWPFDPYFGALPVYAYDGTFWVDDSQVSDLQMQQNGFGGEMMSSSLSGPGDGGGGCTNCVATNICTGPTNFTVTYQLSTTNTPPYETNDLWLEMVIDTNNVGNLIIHTPTPNSFYDVFGTTNLSPYVPSLNQTNWTWLQRAPGAPTNLLWTNITCEKWFRLGTLLDEDLDGLTSASELLSSHTNPKNGDTDHDGLGDRDELLQSRNPLVGDSPSPIIYVTSPTNSLTAQKWIQLDGYCTQRLSRISYWVYTNGVVSDSGMGYLTNQFYDVAAKNFTTNFFRCYDLRLAVGVNTIVLQAVDALNNTNSLSVNYTVDFSVDTNAPVFTLQWPTNGMAVSGNNFTMNGTVNNPSASVKVSVTFTNETTDFYGIVSGSGRNEFWVPDMTLPAGTSTVSVVVTSPGGISSTSIVSLIKNSDAEFTIQPDSYALNEFNQDLPGNVSGYIRGSGYSVSLNGRTGTTSYNSEMDITYWTVTNIPGNEVGWMELVAVAVPSGGGAPITAKYEFEKPPLMRLKEWHLDTTTTAEGFPVEVPPHHEVVHYKRGEGGSSYWGDSGCISTWAWTANDVFTGYSKYCDDVLQSGSYYEAPPTFTGELTEEYQEVTDGNNFHTFARSLNQNQEMRAGGKPYPGRKDLADFSVSATEHDYRFNNDEPGYFVSTNLGPVSASAIKLFGKSPNANWKVPELVVPSGLISIAPLVAVPNAGVNLPVPSQAKLQIMRGNKDITQQAKRVYVGEQIALTCQASFPIVASNFQWSVPGNRIKDFFVSTDSDKTNGFPVPMNPADFTSNTVTFHWVDGSDNSLFPVECKATVAGEEMSAVTYFNVLRPSAEWTAEFRDVVTVDANYANPGVWLHFGGKTNDGIFFTMSNVNLKGYLGSYAFSCVQLMDTTALMNVTNTGTTPPSPQYSIQTVYSGMDADEPYKFEDFGQVKWAQTEDSPGSPLGFPIYQYSRTDSAEMFLMFQPQAPSIPVPLRSISWTWSGTATNFPWGLNSSPTNRAITAINPNVTQHPFWTNSHLKSRVSTTNNGW